MRNQFFSRIVVGGGLFGTYAALVLADRGHSVCLIERDNRLLGRASYVNQARLHTGFHYPRSLVTALEALGAYERFRQRFPQAVCDFKQVYAVARHGSKTSAAEFARFVDRLDVSSEVVDPSRWFQPNAVDAAWLVEEPTFDGTVLRDTLAREVSENDLIQLESGSEVVAGELGRDDVRVTTDSGRTVAADGLIICAYADTNGVRSKFGLEPMSLAFELAEVMVGRLPDKYRATGITVMDGPFWSVMPFGSRHLSTLTSVGNTPLLRCRGPNPVFACQGQRPDCAPARLKDCNSCSAAPMSARVHHLQQMRRFVVDDFVFRPRARMLTTKAVLASAEADDARPTVVKQDQERVWTVFSGKVNTLMDLDAALQ